MTSSHSKGAELLVVRVRERSSERRALDCTHTGHRHDSAPRWGVKWGAKRTAVQVQPALACCRAWQRAVTTRNRVQSTPACVHLSPDCCDVACGTAVSTGAVMSAVLVGWLAGGGCCCCLYTRGIYIYVHVKLYCCICSNFLNKLV